MHVYNLSGGDLVYKQAYGRMFALEGFERNTEPLNT